MGTNNFTFQETTALKKISKLSKRLRIVQGGTSASKTISILIWLISLAQQDKKPTLTSVVSESFPHLKRGAIRDFLLIMEDREYFNPERWNKTDYTYTFETGSKIEFFSADQPGKVRGPRRDRLFLNEANNISFETFEQLEIRTNNFIFLDYNPVSGFWVHENVLNVREDYDFLKLNYKDNEALAEDVVQSIEQRKNRPNWWKVYGLGELGELEGKIYSDWKIIDEVPHEARLERYGVDFGYFPDPATIVAVYYYNGGYIVDEITYQLEMSNREMANTLKNLPHALIIADSAEPKSIAELQSYGLNVTGTPKGKDSVQYGIKTVQDQKISLTKRSLNLLKEYRNYLWKTGKDGNSIPGTPEDGNDHCLDALRYAVMSLFPVIRSRENRVHMQQRPRTKINIAV
jgi:phage terminase large subunit